MTKIMILKWELLSLHSAGDHLTSLADTAWLSCTFVLTGPQNHLVDFTSEPGGLASVRHIWPSSEQLLDESKSQAYFFISSFCSLQPCSGKKAFQYAPMGRTSPSFCANVVLSIEVVSAPVPDLATLVVLFACFLVLVFPCAWMRS